MQPCGPVYTDDTLRELAVHGTEQFPFTCYFSHMADDPTAVPWHWHREVELVLVTQGTAQCMLGNEQLAVQAGEAVFIHSGIIHSFNAPLGADLVSILFMPEFIAPEDSALHRRYVAPFLSAGCSHTLLRNTVPWQADAIADLRRLAAMAQDATHAAELKTHAIVCGLWALLLEHLQELCPLDRADCSALMQARLQRMIAFIKRHYAARLTLADIAADASISKSEALRCFRQGVQTTPIAYLNQYRLCSARSRLLATAAPVTDIAVECGFASTAYFDRVFRRSFGQSPAAYRKQSGLRPA